MSLVYQYRGKDNLLPNTASRADFDSWLRKLTMEIESSGHPQSLIDRLIENKGNNNINNTLTLEGTMGNTNMLSLTSLSLTEEEKEAEKVAEAAKAKAKPTVVNTAADELSKFSRYAYTIIYHSLSNDLNKQFSYIPMNNPFALLNAIKELFQSLHTRSQHEIREECMNVRMVTTENIYQYYSKIQRLKVELITSFTDKLHTANLDQEIQSYFVKGLLPKYKEQAKTIIGTKLNSNNQIIPTTTTELVERLAIYERQLHEYNNSNENENQRNPPESNSKKAFTAASNNNGKDQTTCPHCKKVGYHVPAKCWSNPANPDNRIEEFKRKKDARFNNKENPPKEPKGSNM